MLGGSPLLRPSAPDSNPSRPQSNRSGAKPIQKFRRLENRRQRLRPEFRAKDPDLAHSRVSETPIPTLTH